MAPKPLQNPQVTTVNTRGVAYAEPPKPGYTQSGETRPQRRDTPASQPGYRPGHACKQGVQMTTLTDVEVREGTYGEKVIAVEPGGAEFIPLSERHGRPLQLFWTWTSPNMEFATVFVGFIGVAYFGLSFWATFIAVLLGTLLGSI